MDVSVQPISPIFKGQVVQEECLEHVGTQLYNIPEERISHLHRGGILKSRSPFQVCIMSGQKTRKQMGQCLARYLVQSVTGLKVTPIMKLLQVQTSSCLHEKVVQCDTR
jgi:hypothetical protein